MAGALPVTGLDTDAGSYDLYLVSCSARWLTTSTMSSKTKTDTKMQERPVPERSALIPYGIVKTTAKGKEVDKLLDTHQRSDQRVYPLFSNPY